MDLIEYGCKISDKFFRSNYPEQATKNKSLVLAGIVLFGADDVGNHC